MKKETVFDILKELSGKDTISDTDTLQEDIGLDSLGMVTMLVVLEDQLSIQLDESDMNPFDLSTVEDVILLAEKYCEVTHEEAC